MIMSFINNCTRRVFSFLKISQRQYLSLPRDVIVYENHSNSFIRIIVACSTVQSFVIYYMSYTTFQSMPAFFSWIPAEKKTGRSKSNRLPLSEWKVRGGVALFCSLLSTGILFSAVMYGFRSVSSVTLLRNSNKVVIETFTPLGTRRSFVQNIEDISAAKTRIDATAHVSLKMRDKPFRFILDKEGSFPQSALFDRTIGIKRGF